jgi:hypothetical protein
MRNRGTILAIAVFILGNGTSAGLQITGIVNMFLGWAIIILSTVVSAILFWYGLKLKEQATIQKDGLVLLTLLDEAYFRLKWITRMSIRKLRSKDWQDMATATTDLMWLTDMDIESAIEKIMIDNLHKFMSGQPLTLFDDSKQLGEKIRKSPSFTRNPEDIAKDASVILKEKVPYLKKKMEHDRIYKRLLKRIDRERDKFPSENISNGIDAYLDHSIKINAAWVMSVHDLDGMPQIERLVKRRFPMKLKVILMGLPGRMDEEMRRYRNKVSIAILDFHKENANELHTR